MRAVPRRTSWRCPVHRTPGQKSHPTEVITPTLATAIAYAPVPSSLVIFLIVMIVRRPNVLCHCSRNGRSSTLSASSTRGCCGGKGARLPGSDARRWRRRRGSSTMRGICLASSLIAGRGNRFRRDVQITNTNLVYAFSRTCSAVSK